MSGVSSSSPSPFSRKTVIQVLTPSSQNQVCIIPKSPNSLTTPPIYTHIPINPYIPKTYHTSPFMDGPHPPPTCLSSRSYHTAPLPFLPSTVDATALCDSPSSLAATKHYLLKVGTVPLSSDHVFNAATREGRGNTIFSLNVNVLGSTRRNSMHPFRIGNIFWLAGSIL